MPTHKRDTKVYSAKEELPERGKRKARSREEKEEARHGWKAGDKAGKQREKEPSREPRRFGTPREDRAKEKTIPEQASKTCSHQHRSLKAV